MWAFHDHFQFVQRWANRGLFGALIVRDPEADEVDHEIPLFVHQLAGDVALDGFESPTLSNGQSFAHTFGDLQTTLLTVKLPSTVRKGQHFRIVAHQISGQPRRLQGAFQLTIPVADGTTLRGDEERALSVLRHIGAAIPVEEQWHAVFARYLDVIAGRVRGLGGNPDTIQPSPDGSGEAGQSASEPHDNGGVEDRPRRRRRRR